MSIQPQAIDDAFHALYYGGQADQERALFSLRWGSLSDEAFTQALTAGTLEEKALAIFALGKEETAQSNALLSACLGSQEPMERWPAAFVLGERHDPRAFPELITFLDKSLPPHVHPLERGGGLYHFWRLKTVVLLSKWRHDGVTPVLRRALITAWTLEQAELPEVQRIWHQYQDELAYALGSLGAFGTLTDFILPISHRHRWTVTLSCGFLQIRQRYGDLLTQLQINTALKGEVAQILEGRFGLSAVEQAEYIDGYADAYFG